MGGDPGISAFPEEDNIFCWKGTITGSKDTVFEGTDYRLSLSFSNDYPFKPPKIKFETCCFHPNVDLYGNICLDILQVHNKSFLLLQQLLLCYWLISWICQRSTSTLKSKIWFHIVCRINGRPLMMWGRYCSQFKAFLEVTPMCWPLSFLNWFDPRSDSPCFVWAEPNISSPLNNQAAQLWSNQEGNLQ